MTLRRLDSSDAAAYRELRLTALRDHADAFAASYDDELARQESETAKRLVARHDQVTIGAFDGERLVGVGTLVRFGGAKELHKARVVGMFVSPEARGRGTGKAILEHLIAEARDWGVTDLRLAVTVGNEAARTLYAESGFRSYGVEPRSLRLDARFYDVELMSLELG